MTMQKEEGKICASLFFEGMTSIRAIFAGRNNEDCKNDRRILRLYYDKAAENRLSKELRWLSHRAEEDGFPMLAVTSEEIDALSIGNSHGGLIAECTPRTIPMLTPETTLPHKGFFALLEGIEDPYNFGYSLRSLYAAGVDGILLPERNWMSAAGVVARSSAGASEMLPCYTANALCAADIFKTAGYRVVCADLRTDILLPDAQLALPLLLIVGGEKRGISRALLDKCDFAVKIPYAREFNASLSAASAATMLAYEVMRQNR